MNSVVPRETFNVLLRFIDVITVRRFLNYPDLLTPFESQYPRNGQQEKKILCTNLKRIVHSIIKYQNTKIYWSKFFFFFFFSRTGSYSNKTPGCISTERMDMGSVTIRTIRADSVDYLSVIRVNFSESDCNACHCQMMTIFHAIAQPFMLQDGLSMFKLKRRCSIKIDWMHHYFF